MGGVGRRHSRVRGRRLGGGSGSADIFCVVDAAQPVAEDAQRRAWLREGRRDAGQVLANGGAAAACLLLPLVGFPQGFLLFLAALAAANADTWATEIGSALGGQPYDIRTGQKAPAGTSGAVSLPGTAAALAGAALLGAFAGSTIGGAVVAASGFAGALADSLLGATVQAQWRDPLEGSRWTERPQAYPPERGWRQLGNDGVNLLCTLVAAGGAALLLRVVP